jgi:hypothetical protein
VPRPLGPRSSDYVETEFSVATEFKPHEQEKNIMSANLIAHGCILTAFCSGIPTMTLPEFRQIISEGQQPCSTGRFIYSEVTMEASSHMIDDGNTPAGRINEMNRHKWMRVEATVDWNGQRAKTKEEDLRDIGRMMQEKGLTARDRANLDQGREVVTSGAHVMFFYDGNRLDTGPELDLVQAPGPVVDKLDLVRLGCIAPEALSGQWDTTFSAMQVDGQQRLVVRREASVEGSSASCVLECDPALGYRYRSARVYSNGRLVKEELADDFRDVGGTPYPHKYRTRFFDETGTLSREVELTFEKVELNLPVTDDDFTISAPAGTRVVDTIVSGRESFLQAAEKVSIQGILNQYASQVAMAEMRNLALDSDKGAMPAKVEEWEIVIPDARVEGNRRHPFVLDLGQAVLVSAGDGGELDWEQIDRALVTLEKGDLAWNGELVLLRGASLSPAAKSEQIVVRERGSYKVIQIREGSQLPVSLVVRNRMAKEYLVTIVEITSRGMRVVCKHPAGAPE